MKRFFTLTLVIMFSLLLFACSNEERLILYNWGEYLNPEIKELFTKETGIKVTEITFDSSQISETSMRSKNRYDIVFATTFTVDKLKDEIIDNKHMLQKINKTPIDGSDAYLKFDEADYSSDLKYLINKSKKENGGSLDYDILDYAIPYAVGTFGILYNADKVPEEKVVEMEWDIIKEDIKGTNFAIYDFPVETLSTAIFATNNTVAGVNDKVLNEALDWLNEIPRRNRDFITDGIFDEIPSGVTDLVFALSGEGGEIISRGIEDPNFNLNLKYHIPVNHGKNVWVDCMIIPRNARVDLAYKFINFLYEKKKAENGNDFYPYAYINADALGFQCPIQSVLDKQIEDVKNLRDLFEVGTLQYGYANEKLKTFIWEVGPKDELLLLPPKYRNLLDEIWLKFRALSSNLF